MISLFSKLIAPYSRRIRLMVGRGVVAIVNDALKIQGLQISLLADEVRDNVERFQDYGFTSHPHPGAEAITLSVGGSRDHCVVIKVDDRRYRLKGLAEGEVAIYTDEGDKIHLKRGREIEVVGGEKVMASTKVAVISATTSAKVDSPNTEITGNVAIGGNLIVTGTGVVTGALSSATSVADPTGTMQGMRGVYNGHTHPENGEGGGTTSAPNQGM